VPKPCRVGGLTGGPPFSVHRSTSRESKDRALAFAWGWRQQSRSSAPLVSANVAASRTKRLCYAGGSAPNSELRRPIRHLPIVFRRRHCPPPKAELGGSPSSPCLGHGGKSLGRS
jgi:hypothetical protein